MHSSAIDAPKSKQALSLTTLKRHTYIWLLLPVFVFAVGWMHWYIALPLIILMAAGLIPRKQLTQRNTPFLTAFPLFTPASFCVLAVFIILMIISGWGGYGNQHPDHIVRNACLHELVNSPWPVTFPDGDVLIYNTGFWLVPALAGKLAGLEAARILTILWGAWGLYLTWLWLCIFCGKRSLLSALIMVMFGSMLNLQSWLGMDFLRLHYFGTTEQIMCSANASIPVFLFFIFLVSGHIPLTHIPLLFSTIAFYSPLAALGGLPLVICQWLQQWKDERVSIHKTLIHPSFLAAYLLGICFLLYYMAIKAPSSHMGIRPFYTQGEDFLLIATSFLLYALFCRRDFRRNPLFICTLATGLILPFFYVNGDVNDLLCKGSVPAMACLLAFVSFSWEKHPKIRIWIWILLLLGFAPRFNLPYYCCAVETIRTKLTPKETESVSLITQEWQRLTYTPLARHQDQWGRTMHHPGHRWYPYYAGSPQPWNRLIYRF